MMIGKYTYRVAFIMDNVAGVWAVDDNVFSNQLIEQTRKVFCTYPVHSGRGCRSCWIG